MATERDFQTVTGIQLRALLLRHRGPVYAHHKHGWAGGDLGDGFNVRVYKNDYLAQMSDEGLYDVQEKDDGFYIG